jgi:NADH dehydrogenase [ubiquinone] 1 alpha subcomplex assembly factor 7
VTESLTETLAKAAALGGSLSIAQFMAAANAHYYATRDPLGSDGDFTTAPEISQMFGELVGAWLADLWLRAGQPAAHYVELGPGRATLASDATRVMARSGLEPAIHFVETSPTLRAMQKERMPKAQFHDTIDTLPTEGALLIVANEFFDALPIHQMIRTADDWRERRVVYQQGLFLPLADRPVPDGLIPPTLHAAAPGAIIETCPAGVAVAEAIARRISAQGGAGLIIDYGYQGPAVGETFQAVKGHGFANPFASPGEQDLSAHVDFGTLGVAAERGGAIVSGPVAQAAWLGALGIASRAAMLAASSPHRSDEIASAVNRLTSADAMGQLFLAMALTAPNWPGPSGF